MTWRGTAGGVGCEKDAFGERVDLDGTPGVDEGTKTRRAKRRRIGAELIRRARGAMLWVLEVADEIVVRERRDDEHCGIQRDAQPFHDRHEVLHHLLSKDNPDPACNTAEIALIGPLRQAAFPEDARYSRVLRIGGDANPLRHAKLCATDREEPHVRRFDILAGCGRV